VNEEVAYKKFLKRTNTDEIRKLCRYLDIVQCKWFNKTKRAVNM
jgi:hypothetical protein